MSDSNLDYVELAHATIGNSVGTAHMKGMYTDSGGPVLALSVAGPCVCGQTHRPHTAMLSTGGAVGVIAQLTERLGEVGMDRVSIAAAVETELAALADTVESPDVGQLYDTCPRCHHPDCWCDPARGWTEV